METSKLSFITEHKMRTLVWIVTIFLGCFIWLMPETAHNLRYADHYATIAGQKSELEANGEKFLALQDSISTLNAEIANQKNSLTTFENSTDTTLFAATRDSLRNKQKELKKALEKINNYKLVYKNLTNRRIDDSTTIATLTFERDSLMTLGGTPDLQGAFKSVKEENGTLTAERDSLQAVLAATRATRDSLLALPPIVTEITPEMAKDMADSLRQVIEKKFASSGSDTTFNKLLLEKLQELRKLISEINTPPVASGTKQTPKANKSQETTPKATTGKKVDYSF